MSALPWGPCSTCGRVYKLRVDGTVRWHRGCPGSRLPPLGQAPKLPELPPGYEITYSDDNEDPQYNGWDIWIRGDLYDGRDEDEAMPQERAEAVEECWSMWLRYDCSSEWRAFIKSMRGTP